MPAASWAADPATGADEATVADGATAAPVRAAERVPLAARGLLIAIASAGERLVAVGDRGIIVLSDDRGVR